MDLRGLSATGPPYGLVCAFFCVLPSDPGERQQASERLKVARLIAGFALDLGRTIQEEVFRIADVAEDAADHYSSRLNTAASIADISNQSI
ncbi:hypothetical protein J2D73_05030 [Acetobacter sacchari]|uniref:Uncharacterized protein n=1 Tax=Acetobacter sacchari TaxID=2661687 RepID=A0ABS3LTC6_9PROT|nr:hypothetical protein [Acetobacter sacchari]MBO1359160.1 hypothetical protein [Acetobacter sacchari]